MTERAGWHRGLALAFVAVFVIAPAVPSFGPRAQELDASETAALATTVAAYADAFERRDLAEMLDHVPPRIFEFMARGAGLDVADVREAAQAAMAAVLDDIVVESQTFDIDAAETRALEDGTPYVLIPTRIVMNAGQAGRIATESQTLAFMDEGRWYLMRVSELQQLLILRDVYPGFSRIEFPADTMQILE